MFDDAVPTGRFVGAAIDKYATQFLVISFTAHLMVEFVIIQFLEMRSEPVLGGTAVQSLVDDRGLDAVSLGLG